MPQELERRVAEILAGAPSRILLSQPRGEGRRATLTPEAGGWRLERLSATQAFHEHLAGSAEAAARLCALLRGEYRQLTAFTPAGEERLRLTKKEKLLYSRTKGTAAPQQQAPPPAHNREKKRLLAEGVAVPPLVDMGILTPDGRVVKARYDKYRQVNRFLELVDDALRDTAPGDALRVVDFGCGRSTLTFVLYHYLREVRGLNVSMLGLDLKADVVENCAAAAKKYGYEGLHFAVGDIAGWQEEGPVDLVVSLHACDTATDHALAQAVRWQAKRIFAVPCCQHEANSQLESEALHLLARYGIIKERSAALMTDAIRANLLVAAGYKTQVLEFVDLAHTPKNLLLRAIRTHQPAPVRQRALAEVQALCEAFSLSPALLGLLGL